jgi:hypothetical protein
MMSRLTMSFRGEIVAMQASILLVADYAAVDASGKLNVIGAFNIIYALSFPFKHPQMHLVIRLVATLGEFERERKLRIVLWDQDGAEKWATPEIPFRVSAPKDGKLGHHDAIIGIQGMEFEKPGEYSFHVYVDGDSKGDIPIDVVERAKQPSAET